MPKYIVTFKFFCYLFPKKNYNKKTLVFFYLGERVNKLFPGKKTAFSSRFGCILYIKSSPHFCTNI